MRLYERRPYKDPSPTRVHVLMGIALAGLGLLLALSVTSVAKDQLDETRLVERARSEGKAAGKAAAKQEVKEQVAEDIHLEVTDQLDDRLLIPSTIPGRFIPDLPPELLPVDPTTTTLPGPFDLTTTTLPEPPAEPPPVTTTTIEVPTTVTIPDPGLEPLP